MKVSLAQKEISVGLRNVIDKGHTKKISAREPKTTRIVEKTESNPLVHTDNLLKHIA